MSATALEILISQAMLTNLAEIHQRSQALVLCTTTTQGAVSEVLTCYRTLVIRAGTTATVQVVTRTLVVMYHNHCVFLRHVAQLNHALVSVRWSLY